MFKVHKDVLQAIHDYLLTRPMGEVETLVNAIRQSPYETDKNDSAKNEVNNGEYK